MTISIIAAVASNRAIGRDGKLLFHIRDDMRRFKDMTTGHPVIMGRKTFESLPKGALPNRLNIVITGNKSYNAPGALTAASLDEALRMLPEDSDVFIIGGGLIYAEAIPRADRLCLTEIDAEADGADTFFPPIDRSQWEISELSAPIADPATGISYRFSTYIRKTGR